MITILEYVEDRWDCCKWDLYETYELETEEDAFVRMYNLRRESRYDNRRHYIFSGAAPMESGWFVDVQNSDNSSLRKKYNEWYDSYNTIERFYGGFVYD